MQRNSIASSPSVTQKETIQLASVSTLVVILVFVLCFIYASAYLSSK